MMKDFRKYIKESMRRENKEKCQFCMTQTIFMGRVLSDQVVSVQEERFNLKKC